MSSNIKIKKSNSTPGIIVNNYSRDLDLLNCVSLKARYDLRDIHAYSKIVEKKNLEYRRKLLNSKIKAKEKGDDIYEISDEFLSQFKLLHNNNTNKKNNFKNYMTPIEERQKRFSDYYKNLFNDLKKKEGLNNYTHRLIPNFIKIQKAQKYIQNRLTKSKSIIIKRKNNNKSNIDNIGNSSKKLPSIKLSLPHEKNNSFLEKPLNKSHILKIIQFKEEEKSKSFNHNINDKIINIDKIEKNKKIRIHKIKNINKKNYNMYNNYLYDKNFKPITETPSFRILSQRGNIQFNNSIWRTKDINKCVSPYTSNEINDLFKHIKEQKKIIFK